MSVRPVSWLARPWLLRALWTDLLVAVRLLREPRVPLAVKGILPAAALYLVSPIDFIPDVLAGLGEIDDLVIVIAALGLFLRLCPGGALAFHRSAVITGRPFAKMAPADVVIDADYRRE